VTALQDLYDRFPRLADGNHAITSQPTDEYNCVSWVERCMDEWWEPGFSWPQDIRREDYLDEIAMYVALFARSGFEVCESAAHEDGFLKIAIYGTEAGEFMHVAKELPRGWWSSKAGVLHDLKHECWCAFEGSWAMQSANAKIFMRRERPAGDDFVLEETGLLSI
jgi:hypothetical protein